MYEVTLYDLAGHLTDARQVKAVTYDVGGIRCLSETSTTFTFDLFFPYHRVYEVKRVD